MILNIGYKFEAVSVIPNTWGETSREKIEGRVHEVVNNKAQYCSVVRTGFGKAKLVIGGEVDASKQLEFLVLSLNILTRFFLPVWDSKPVRKEDPINWVELKTTCELFDDKERIKYERKLLKFWAQSFLLGVPKIVVGFRDRNGMLLRLEELETHGLPGKVKREGRGSWDGNICINFTAAFLECKSIIHGNEYLC